MTSDLSAFHAIILGLVEGLTEFLPISSTGHLLAAQRLLGLGGTTETDMALDTYAICIQAGAILAVLVLYRARVTQVVQGLFGRSEDGRRLLVALAAAFLPAAVIGVALSDPIRSVLFGVGPVAGAWIVGGLLILRVTRQPWSRSGTTAIEQLTIPHALIIGVAQAAALWPGVSRSLVTILAALALGYTMRAAVEFSFLLGLITLAAATAYEGIRSGDQLVATFGIATPFLGLVVAFVSAVVAVRWMVTWLQSRGLEVFGWYRIAIGVAAVGALAAF
ncbi:MAG: undecaprenyl-diphosphate phosphatase [Acidimicrobiales bacterium]|nr:undecaprenyl-diphosphate phosphatase [Acidimicrobiales bacterium]